MDAQQLIHLPAFPDVDSACTATWPLQILPHRQVRKLAQPHDWVLRVRQGCLWLTLEQSPQAPSALRGDVLIRAGEQLMVPAHTEVVLESVVPGAEVAHTAYLVCVPKLELRKPLISWIACSTPGVAKSG